MHNRIGFNRLGRKSSHRKALHRNMVTSLIKYERIETTKAKAKEIRRTAEKLVTRAKVDSVHNRRIAAKIIYEKEMVNKLFTVVGPRFTERPGGYTRMLKLGNRTGDAAEMVILEFLKDEEGKTPAKKTASRKKPAAKTSGSSKPAVSKAAAPKAGSKSSPVSKKSETVDDSPDSSIDEKPAETPVQDSGNSAKPVDTAVDEDGQSKSSASEDSTDKEKPAE